MLSMILTLITIYFPDYSHGDYGKGLYFSKYPSTAAQFSAVSIYVFFLITVLPQLLVYVIL